MILIADGGSTKVDWIALDNNKNELFRVKTIGLNPAVIPQAELLSRVKESDQLLEVKHSVEQVFFYGAGCGTPKPIEILKEVLQSIFTEAKISIEEDMLGAVYASAGRNPAMVCILGTGSNSCYFDGNEAQIKTPSLGYALMDEASGNYFGKLLIRDYYYEKMPKRIAEQFEKEFDLEADTIKLNLYRQPNPNRYLASFAKFMFNFKDDKYIVEMIKKGFQEFFEYRILPYKLNPETPIYFIGSIAFCFRDLLDETAKKNGLMITDVIQRPIDNLIAFHKKYLS